jgi:hypothetical protein
VGVVWQKRHCRPPELVTDAEWWWLVGIGRWTSWARTAGCVWQLAAGSRGTRCTGPFPMLLSPMSPLYIGP